jgi:hypothetical protein
MVGWTNFGITQSTLLLPRCDSYDHILLYILELINGTHFEIMGFNMYIMKSIGMKSTLNCRNYGLLKLKIRVCNTNINEVNGLWFGFMMDLKTF